MKSDNEGYKEYIDEGLRLALGNQKRFSELLSRQLEKHLAERTLNVFAVCDVIAFLEGRRNRAYPTKEADCFLHPPLKGLWKKHFFEAKFIPKNLEGQIRRREYFKSCFLDVKGGTYVEDVLDDLTRKFTVDAFSLKAKECSLTGEWLIFAKYMNENYYLMIANHDDGDESIRKSIDDNCVQEFSFLKEVLV